MYLTLEEVKDEIEKILRNGKNVMESVCVLSTFNKQGQTGNKLSIEVIYNPVFSKQDSDMVSRKVMFRPAQGNIKKEKDVSIRPEDKGEKVPPVI